MDPNIIHLNTKVLELQQQKFSQKIEIEITVSNPLPVDSSIIFERVRGDFLLKVLGSLQSPPCYIVL